MRYLCYISAIIICASLSACLAADNISLEESSDRVVIRAGEQSLTVRLDEATLRFDCPQAELDITAQIDSADGFIKPLRPITPPKVYRGKDSVAALIWFEMPDGRKLRLHIDAYPGIEAVFVTSSITGSFSGKRDYFRWVVSGDCDDNWASGTKDSVYKDWVLMPTDSSGIVIMTNGIVGCDKGSALIEALPKSRFLRGEESLDIGFGLAGVGDAAEAEALAKRARERSTPALKREHITTKDYGFAAPKWLRADTDCLEWDDQMKAGDIPAGAVILRVPADMETIAKVRQAGSKAIVQIDPTHFADPLDPNKHPDWALVDSQGNQNTSHLCLHQPDIRQALLSMVCDVMNLGADGVLLENVLPVAECCGPKFEKHTHANCDLTNTGQLDNLCRETYKLIKSLGSDKVLILNSGIAPSLWSCCDGQIWDGFGSQEGPELQFIAEEHSQAIKRGKVAIAKPFSADKNEYVRAYAKLHGWVPITSLAITKSELDKR